MELPLLVMVTNRTIATALFTIAIALSLVAVSGVISSAHAIAAKKQIEYSIAPQVSLTKDKPVSTIPQKTNSYEAHGLTLGNPDAVSEKQIKSLSKCESTAAVDGHLALTDVTACYHKVF